jgi:hypothetical protein
MNTRNKRASGTAGANLDSRLRGKAKANGIIIAAKMPMEFGSENPAEC